MMRSRKGEWDDVKNLVLVVVVILIMVGIYFIFIKNTNETLSNCPGTCKDRCSFGETQLSNSCSVCGEKQKGVCCATVKDIQKKPEDIAAECKLLGKGPNTSNPPQNPDTSSQDPSIEIRKGDDVYTRIGGGSAEYLESGRTYTYRVWGFGKGAQTCSLLMLDNNQGSTGEATTVQGMSLNVHNQNCASSTASPTNMPPNVASFQLSPQYDPAGKNNYKLQLVLKDSKGEAIASTHLFYRVGPSAAPSCPGTCNDIPVQNCLQEAARCGLSCEANAAAGTCNQASI